MPHPTPPPHGSAPDAQDPTPKALTFTPAGDQPGTGSGQGRGAHAAEADTSGGEPPRRGRGRPRRNLTEEEQAAIIMKIKEGHGHYTACDALGIDWVLFQTYLPRDPEFRMRLEGAERYKDEVAEGLIYSDVTGVTVNYRHPARDFLAARRAEKKMRLERLRFDAVRREKREAKGGLREAGRPDVTLLSNEELDVYLRGERGEELDDGECRIYLRARQKLARRGADEDGG